MEESKHAIILKEHISEEDYNSLKNFEALCKNYDKTSLKLELDFKNNLNKNPESIKEVNEFIYNIDGKPIGYVGINCFGGGKAEINGMVHPDYRRKGIFKKLMSLVFAELISRGHKIALLLSDHDSASGIGFIKDMGAEYSFSEYKMNLENRTDRPKNIGISLRRATKGDFLQKAIMDSSFFGDEPDEENAPFQEIEEGENEVTYMAEKDNHIIGKIRLDNNSGIIGIYGFGVLPEYRGKGYGREILNLALDKAGAVNPDCIYLEVACENKNALNLYKSCGFIEKSVMDYYEFKL